MQKFKHSSNYGKLFAYISAGPSEASIHLLNTQLCKCFPKLHGKMALNQLSYRHLLMPGHLSFLRGEFGSLKTYGELLHIFYRQQGLEDEYIYFAQLIFQKELESSLISKVALSKYGPLKMSISGSRSRMWILYHLY